MSIRPNLPLAVLLSILLATSTFARAIAQWGRLGQGVPGQPIAADIVTTAQAFVPPVDFTTFVPGAIISSIQGADYYPSSDHRTASFNGAFNEDPTTGTAQIFQHPTNASRPDQIQVWSAASPTTQVSGMFVFEDLLFGLGPLEVLRTSLYHFDNPAQNSSLRFLFQDATDRWYASQVLDIPYFGFGQRGINVADANWFEFTPFGMDGNAAGVATIGMMAAPNFTNVEAVGLYYELDKPAGDRVGVSIGYFEATVPTVPGDFEGDLDVDGSDFLAWQREKYRFHRSEWDRNYGTPKLGASARFHAVPEPSCTVLFVLGCSLVMLEHKQSYQISTQAIYSQ